MVATQLKRVRVAGLLLLPLVAAGCSVGPNYHPQQANVPSSFPSVATSINTSLPPPLPPQPNPVTTQPQTPPAKPEGTPTPTPANPDAVSVPGVENLAQWWTVFNDPILTRLVTESLSGNLDLRAAELRIYEARATRGIIEGGLFPQISDDASATTSRQAANVPKRGLIGRTSNLFRHGLNATWELDFFGGTRRAIESADAQIDASIEDRRTILVALAAEVGSEYISLRGFQRELEIARENVVSQQKSVDLTDRKFKAGIVSALDVANAKALVANTRAQIPVLETAAQQMIYSLSVLLGREPAALDEELKKPAGIPPPPPAVPVGLPSDLVRRRPDIRRAEALIHSQTAQVGVAKADLFPKFSLTGAVGFQGQKQSALLSWSHRFYDFGPSVSWPIFAGGKIGCNIKLQKAIQLETEVVYQQTVLTALRDVDNALFALTKEREHHEQLVEAVVNYRQVVQLSLKLYQDGNTDFLQVITAQRFLYEAEDALVQSEKTMSSNVVALYKALGGGWTEGDVLPCLPDPISTMTNSR